MNVLVTEHEVNWCAAHTTIRMQVIRINLYNDFASLYTFFMVCYLTLFVSLIVIFSDKNQAFAVTSWRDKHHVNNIFLFKLS